MLAPFYLLKGKRNKKGEDVKEIVALMLCFLIVGCAAVEPIPAEQKQHIYTANFDTVWSTIIEILTQESCPLKTIEKQSGLIHTDYIPSNT